MVKGQSILCETIYYTVSRLRRIWIEEEFVEPRLKDYEEYRQRSTGNAQISEITVVNETVYKYNHDITAQCF